VGTCDAVPGAPDCAASDVDMSAELTGKVAK
jgi:hypothetical protein